ncbi:MAG: homoserine O-acetyltransferase [Myxococcota bacterium]
MSNRTITFKAENGVEKPANVRFAENTLHKIIFKEFITERGDKIVNLRVAYRVFGKPNEAKNNIVLVFHALTGDANCAGYTKEGVKVEGWWEELFEKEGGVPLDRYCVICPNHPSSCYGSSGPSDFEVGGSAPLGPDFPPLNVRDLARVHYELIRRLGIKRLKCVIGGSLGGMIAIEWAVNFPDAAEKVAVIAAPLANNAQALAYNHVQRRCFDIDPNFKGGRYYGGARPDKALSLARQMGMITFRHPGEFARRFGRNTNYPTIERNKYYKIQSYLEHQGEKLLKRFDANSYIKLLELTDAHDISRGTGDFETPLSRVKSELLFVSVDSDVLYPPAEVEEIYNLARSKGAKARYETITSIHGHDGFLIESVQLNTILKGFL